MSFSSPRADFLRKAVNLFLLLVLVLIAWGVWVKQGRFNPAKFGIKPEKISGDQASSNSTAALDFSPIIPDGFEVMGPKELYRRDNLYEKINGKAELYLPAGFAELTCQRLIDKNGSGNWFEVYAYDMNTPSGAFAVYSAQRRDDAVQLDFAEFAYQTTDAIFFVHGRYYIEMLASEDSENILAGMNKLGQNFVNNISVGVQDVLELVILGSERLNTKNVKLIPEDAFGSSELKNIFVAGCIFGDHEVKLFLSRKQSSQKAESVARGYYDFLISNGATLKQSDSPVDNCKILDFYGTTEIIFYTGRFFGGVHEAENASSAIKAVEVLTQELNGSKKQ